MLIFSRERRVKTVNWSRAAQSAMTSAENFASASHGFTAESEFHYSSTKRAYSLGEQVDAVIARLRATALVSRD